MYLRLVINRIRYYSVLLDPFNAKIGIIIHKKKGSVKTFALLLYNGLRTVVSSINTYATCRGKCPLTLSKGLLS